MKITIKDTLRRPRTRPATWGRGGGGGSGYLSSPETHPRNYTVSSEDVAERSTQTDGILLPELAGLGEHHSLRTQHILFFYLEHKHIFRN